ncbi:MAG: carboxypeptidase regulatory-like domain-containing protein [Gemmatimonadota bacterium]|nr:carboxypeptidase regulatory-like domain-containing protein [Gemmatimonadota bacterium]
MPLNVVRTCFRRLALPRSTLVVVAALALSAPLRAQSIRGVVVDPAGDGVAGVVVTLLDSGTNTVGRALSNMRGEFRVGAPGPGTYRIRTLRIGFRPVTSAPVNLVSGGEVIQRIELSGVPFSLDTVKVMAQSSCEGAGDSTMATYAVWEQVRAALTATQLSTAERPITATTVFYERSLDKTSRRVTGEKVAVRTAVAAQPWRTYDPQLLHKNGYVLSEHDSTTYLGPGIDALLSSQFLADHCFKLEEGTDLSSIGIAFEPSRERADTPEIRGTLWLDRKSSQLRSIDFAYTNVFRERERPAGGTMEFARARDGGWLISRWSIRMPVIARLTARGVPLMFISSFRMSGGDLSLAMRGRDTVWARPSLALRGTVVDSASRQGIAGAYITLAGTRLAAVADSTGHFAMSSVLPGEYTAEVHTADLDRIDAVSESMVSFTDSAAAVQIRVPTAAQIGTVLCGNGSTPVGGIVIGNVALKDDSIAPFNARVFAEWKDRSDVLRTVEARTDSSGRYHICRVPLKTSLVIRARTDSASAIPATVQIDSGLFAHADLVVDRSAAHGTLLAGVVYIDSAHTPIADAEVSLPELLLSTRSNERGIFRMTEIPPGVHTLIVRKVGYGALETKLTFDVGVLQREVFLTRTTVLDSVKVLAQRPVLREFEEHRKIGIGKFVTRAQLEGRDGRRLGELLSTLAGVNITFKSGAAFVSGSRGPRSINTPTCLANVYLDRTLMYGKRGDPPFNINSIPPEEIEGIEYFGSAATTPLEYSTLNSACGVIVIWTRR